MTTPGACDVADLLATMRDKRLPGVRDRGLAATRSTRAASRASPFAGAAFTNLTGDHLDYHKTMDNYAAAKARLFEIARRRGRRGRQRRRQVGRPDDPGLPVARHPLRLRQDGRLPRRATCAVTRAGHARSSCTRPTARPRCSMPLIGKHNIENALAAAALVGRGVRAVGQPDRRGPARRAGRAGRLAAGATRAAVRGAGRLRPHGRCAGERPDGAAAADARASSASSSAAAATATAPSGRGWPRTAEKLRRRDLRHQRQPAHGRPARDHRRDRRRASATTARDAGRRRARPPRGDRAGRSPTPSRATSC